MARRTAVLVLVVGALSFAVAITPATAGPSQQGFFICVGDSNTVADQVVPPAGLNLSGNVFGGRVTLTATPAQVAPGTLVRLCTNPGPFNTPVIMFFGFETSPAAPGPVHVDAVAPQLTDASFLQLEAGPDFLETNIRAQSGRMTFDAVQYEFYAVLPANPNASASAPPPAPTTSNDDRSALTRTLSTPVDAVKSLPHDLANLILTLLVLLFITFPAELFNKTLDAHYNEIRAGWRRRLHLPAEPRVSEERRRVAFVVVLIAGAALACLLDPDAGFDARTLVNFVASLAAIAAIAAVHAVAEDIYRRRVHERVTKRVHALPTGLVIGALCVVLSRAVHFRPGYLYGIVAGVVFAFALDHRRKGHVAAVVYSSTLVVGIVAWLLWVPINDTAARHASNLVLSFADDWLGALFVAALVGSALRLMPLRLFPGGDLLRWHRGVWAVVFGLAVFGLLTVMLNPNSSSVQTGTNNWVTCIVLFAAFAAASMAFAGYYHARDAKAAS